MSIGLGAGPQFATSTMSIPAITTALDHFSQSAVATRDLMPHPRVATKRIRVAIHREPDHDLEVRCGRLHSTPSVRIQEHVDCHISGSAAVRQRRAAVARLEHVPRAGDLQRLHVHELGGEVRRCEPDVWVRVHRSRVVSLLPLPGGVEGGPFRVDLVLA